MVVNRSRGSWQLLTKLMVYSSGITSRRVHINCVSLQAEPKLVHNIILMLMSRLCLCRRMSDYLTLYAYMDFTLWKLILLFTCRLKHEIEGVQNPHLRPNIRKSAGKGAADWLSMLVALMFGTYLAYRYQTEGLPTPLLEKVAGVRGFSEERAYRHVKALTALGPHPVGTDTLQRAVQVQNFKCYFSYCLFCSPFLALNFLEL